MTLPHPRTNPVLLFVACCVVTVPQPTKGHGDATTTKETVQTRTMFVRQERVECNDQGEPDLPTILQHGQRVEVLITMDGDTPEGYMRIKRPHGRTCLVPDTALDGKLPEAEKNLADARYALAFGHMADAAYLAWWASVLSPNEPEPLEIQAAIHDANRDEERSREVYALLKALGKRSEQMPIPSLDRPVTKPPAVGQKRYVLATRLRLRSRPSPSAPVITELTINTRVEVQAVDGEFARVTVQSPPTPVKEWNLRAGAGSVRVEERVHPGGYAAWAYLGDKPVAVDALLRQVDVHEQAGRDLEAMVLLERVALLGAPDQALFLRLARRAVAARQWQVAAWAARMQHLPYTGGRVDIQLVYGCKGQKSKAVLVDDDAVNVQNPSRLPGNACVVNVDVMGICTPPTVEDCDLAGRMVNTPAEQKRLEEEQQAEERLNEEITKKWKEERAAFHSRLGNLRETLPHGPYARVRITGSSGQTKPRKSLYAFALSYQRERGCDRLEIKPITVLGAATKGVAWPTPGTETELWIGLPSYSDVIVGLLEDESAASAKEQLDELVATLNIAVEKDVAGVERVLAEQCPACIKGPRTDCADGCGCH